MPLRAFPRSLIIAGSVKFCGNASLRDKDGIMLLNPEKALEKSAMQAQFGSPVTPKKRGFKEVILTTTAGHIASIAVIACFFLIAAIGA